ncbi:GNAT family N-acetyltransferase [Halorubrum vacuolatum]|uniref:L-amino acid N-acyltransferase YncA n=1 Tax=Halorubrum vacuolatum TaxID=63740 RepID=A0A238VE78_HALVU|nr:GNAT family N-acetyltransferase [Halorubrum vacuolatum]SNR32710.1 L-amino acid N-acyltransferase YncA [Halorubrum vacuolatum]
MSAQRDRSDRTTTEGKRSESSGSACGGWDSGRCVGTPVCPPRCPRFLDKEGRRWTLRPAAENDLEALLEMYDAFGPADRAQGVPPIGARRQREWIELLFEEGWNVVAEAEDGRLLGHAVYTPMDVPDPELAVFVHPEYRGRGLGTELCRHVIATAAERGRERLVLHVETHNRAAITVYRRLGFVTEAREVDLRMALELNEPIATDVRRPPAARER